MDLLTEKAGKKKNYPLYSVGIFLGKLNTVGNSIGNYLIFLKNLFYKTIK